LCGPSSKWICASRGCGFFVERYAIASDIIAMLLLVFVLLLLLLLLLLV
jgi:hypothetical protein